MIESMYKSYTAEEQEQIFSMFLINSWSYSKVTTFSRNEKAFEMQYIYGQRSKSSATTVAGQAYHSALQYYFEHKKVGDQVDLANLEVIAFNYINEVPANTWKLQKTTPTVEDCIKKATTTVSNLVRNFFYELPTYEDSISDILEVETYCDEFVVINGVDIPLPCHCVIDLIARTKDDKTVIIDHKSKAVFTSEEEMQLSIGVQSISYVNCYESKTGIKIDEVWFIENKHSQNKDRSPQLNAFKVEITDSTRKLYEALLYEPLKRLITAISDPDYVYLINDSDNYVDRAEIYDFWAKTMISEVEDFNVADAKKDLISRRLKKIRDSSIASISPNVIREFRKNASSFIQYDLSNKNMTQEEMIEHVLRSFGIITRVAHKFNGYSSNTYLLEISAGVKISSVHSHKLDIANALNVSTVRISKELIVYENKAYLAIDFSKKRDKDLIFDPSQVKELKIPIGKDNYENTIYWDLNNHSTPHVLVCGATGSGKSVSIKSTIEYAKIAGVERVVIFDPKYEFLTYKGDPIIKLYNDISDIENAMRLLVDEMNEMVIAGVHKKTLVVFDEFADALANSKKGSELDVKELVQVGSYAPKKGFMGLYKPAEPKMAMKTTGTLKSLEENLKILVQKGRSCGFRVIAATQRASVKVITGDAKVNFPVQICFRVPKETDSRVVIDEAGAESLTGLGDGLIKSPDYPDVVRFQAYYKIQ